MKLDDDESGLQVKMNEAWMKLDRFSELFFIKIKLGIIDPEIHAHELL